MRREEIQKYKERQKKASEEFERLYTLGSGSCPVLKSMPKDQLSRPFAAQIMGECPVAQKYRAPDAIL